MCKILLFSYFEHVTEKYNQNYRIEIFRLIIIDPLHKVPTRKQASDYHGKIPPIFPYDCVLCDITVLSKQVSSIFALFLTNFVILLFTTRLQFITEHYITTTCSIA